MVQCSQCEKEIPDGVKFCTYCGAQQKSTGAQRGSNTGWFQDPEGRWEARYFGDGQMSDKILVGGTPYTEPRVSVADIATSRIGPSLSGGERLLHEVYAFWQGTTKTAYFEDDGILAVTSYRLLKYQTGKGFRSTLRGEGPVKIHWALAWSRDYLDLLHKAATAGQGPAADTLRYGVQVLSGYRSEPMREDRRHPELVGSMRVTLQQRKARDDGQPPGDWRPDQALDRWTRSVTKTGKWTGVGQSKVQNKDLVLELQGSIPTILRIDQLLAAAAESMAG